jgi:hypothetical protein
MSSEFATKAAEEESEALRIEEGVSTSQ